jgi:hypothetical protein
MRHRVLLSIVVLLTGAAPAPAQVGSPSAAPYPSEYPVAADAKQKPVRKSVAARPAARVPEKQAAIAAAKPVAPPAPLPKAAPRATTAAIAPPVPAQAAAPAPDKAKPEKAEPAKAQAAKVAAVKPESDTPANTAAATNISATDLMKIEQELYWSGDYSAVLNGEDRLQTAIKSFQKRTKARITGTLTDEQRAELVAAADRHTQEFGWRVVVDPSTGVRIGLPTKLVPDTHDAVHGTRWSSPHGEVQVETFRIRDSSLAAVFEQQKKAPKTRRIEHSVLNDDGFLITGMQGLKYFSVRAKQRDGEVRGFTLLYDQMMEGIVAPAAVAMTSAFSPFPERAMPFAALSKKVEYGTGLIVGTDGHIVTAGKLAQNCNVIVAGKLGNAEYIGEDSEHGVALLRVYGAGKVPALALPGATPKAGDITLIGIPDPKEQDGAKKLAEIKAKLTGGNAIALGRPVPMAGFAGAAALDTQGQFIGIMQTRNFVLASIDPGLPPVRLVPGAVLREFLSEHHVALAANGNSDARAAVVRIICVRN